MRREAPRGARPGDRIAELAKELTEELVKGPVEELEEGRTEEITEEPTEGLAPRGARHKARPRAR